MGKGRKKPDYGKRVHKDDYADKAPPFRERKVEDSRGRRTIDLGGRIIPLDVPPLPPTDMLPVWRPHLLY